MAVVPLWQLLQAPVTPLWSKPAGIPNALLPFVLFGERLGGVENVLAHETCSP